MCAAPIAPASSSAVGRVEHVRAVATSRWVVSACAVSVYMCVHVWSQQCTFECFFECMYECMHESFAGLHAHEMKMIYLL